MKHVNEFSPAQIREMSQLFLDTPNDKENIDSLKISGRNAFLFHEHQQMKNIQKEGSNNQKYEKQEDIRKRSIQRNKILQQMHKNTQKKRLRKIDSSENEKNGTISRTGKWVGHAIGWSILSSVFFT